MLDRNPQIQETQKISNRITGKTTPTHLIFKLQQIKDKGKNLKRIQREKTPYLWSRKDQNDSRFFLRNQASKKRGTKCLKHRERKTPTNLEICIL